MTAPQTDWVDEGRKHFMATRTHPERRPANYPTRDVHSAQDEAEFIQGFNAAKAKWDRGEGLNGLQSYVVERDEITAEGVRRIIVSQVVT